MVNALNARLGDSIKESIAVKQAVLERSFSKFGSDARDLSAFIYSSLQPLAASHLTSLLPVSKHALRLDFIHFRSLKKKRQAA